MAVFTSVGPAAMKLGSFDFSFIDGMVLTQHTSTTLSWTNATGASVTIKGIGFKPVVSDGALVDLTQGVFQSFSMDYRKTTLEITKWDVAGDKFFDLVAADKWAALGKLMVSGNDIMQGTGGKDVLKGGAGHDFLTGGAGNDKLFGGAKSDFINGGAGSDTLTGGKGSDVFYFDIKPGTAGVDKITDFTHHKDMIGIDHNVFANVGPQGVMDNHWFYTGDPAREGRQGIIYDQAEGKIYNDGDGIGPLQAILFAQVTPGLHLTASDFFVY